MERRRGETDKNGREIPGINNETAMIEEELSMSPILPEPSQIDEA